MAIDPPLRGARFAPLAGRGVALSIARQSVWPGHESRGSAIVVGLGVVDMFGGGAW